MMLAKYYIFIKLLRQIERKTKSKCIKSYQTWSVSSDEDIGASKRIVVVFCNTA